MGSKNDTRTWADHRGSGENGSFIRGGGDARAAKNMVPGNVKAAASHGLFKAKVAALAGAEKVKCGTSRGIEWVKEQYQRSASKFVWLLKPLGLTPPARPCPPPVTRPTMPDDDASDHTQTNHRKLKNNDWKEVEE